MPDLSDDPELDDLYAQLFKKVFKADLKRNEIDLATTQRTAEQFMQGVFEGYGKKLTGYKKSIGKSIGTVQYDTSDYHKLAALEKNVYQFSGAKNWQMMKEMTAALKEGDKVLSYKEWKNKILPIVDEYDERWKKTEYQTAIGSSQMAAKCVDYDKHPKALIKYIDANDERECPICRGYHGIILPWDHPFWRTATPLNHFGCHCSTIRVNDGTRTPEADIPGFEPIPKMFRTNIAENGLVFPPDHPYYIGCPKEVLKEATTLIPEKR